MSEPKLVTFEGKVHLVAENGGSYSLCGVADDAYISEGKIDWEWKESTEKVVDCHLCVAQIKACQAVSVLAMTITSEAGSRMAGLIEDMKMNAAAALIEFVYEKGSAEVIETFYWKSIVIEAKLRLLQEEG